MVSFGQVRSVFAFFLGRLFIGSDGAQNIPSDPIKRRPRKKAKTLRTCPKETIHESQIHLLPHELDPHGAHYRSSHYCRKGSLRRKAMPSPSAAGSFPPRLASHGRRIARSLLHPAMCLPTSPPHTASAAAALTGSRRPPLDPERRSEGHRSGGLRRRPTSPAPHLEHPAPLPHAHPLSRCSFIGRVRMCIRSAWPIHGAGAATYCSTGAAQAIQCAPRCSACALPDCPVGNGRLSPQLSWLPTMRVMWQSDTLHTRRTPTRGSAYVSASAADRVDDFI
jgi:hypothetical protein